MPRVPYVFTNLCRVKKSKSTGKSTAGGCMRSVAAYPSPCALSRASLCFIGLTGLAGSQVAWGVSGGLWHAEDRQWISAGTGVGG